MPMSLRGPTRAGEIQMHDGSYDYLPRRSAIKRTVVRGFSVFDDSRNDRSGGPDTRPGVIHRKCLTDTG
jgi:hypothetical protein